MIHSENKTPEVLIVPQKKSLADIKIVSFYKSAYTQMLQVPLKFSDLYKWTLWNAGKL